MNKAEIAPSSKVSEIRKKRPLSMHEDIPVWYDCCSCEAEPYWLEAMEAEVSTEEKLKVQPESK